MYNIRKYSDCWAVHDEITGASRKLTSEEVERVKNEFSTLKDEKVVAYSVDNIRSLAATKEYYQGNTASL